MQNENAFISAPKLNICKTWVGEIKGNLCNFPAAIHKHRRRRYSAGCCQYCKKRYGEVGGGGGGVKNFVENSNKYKNHYRYLSST